MNISKWIIFFPLQLIFLHLWGCGDLKKAVVVTGPGKTVVISENECFYYQGVHVIAELEIGDTVKALNYEYPKDCMIYKIEMSDGRQGWITLGDNCTVIDVS
ncbi:MAG: hypothetical protein SGI97_01925 [candidate division Zixibacteria bacterium]|nr:hypothetical protein [candidate division Zixibacteria bacterium]